MVSLTLDTPALAAAYDLVGDPQFSHGKLLVEELALTPGERALDVGCGTGRLAAYVADIVGRDGIVYAIDPLPLRVEIAQRIERSNLKVAVGRAEDLSRFTTGSFDAVYFNSVFHWISDQKLALRECRRALRTGGRVGISGPSKEHPHDIDVIVAQALGVSSLTATTRAPHKIDEQELTELFESAGFSVAMTKIRTFEDVFQSSRDVLGFQAASAFGNFLGDLPNGEHDMALAALTRELDRLGGPDGMTLQRHVVFSVGVAR